MADSTWRWLGRIGALVAIPCLIAAPFLVWEWFWTLLIAGVVGLAANMAATTARLSRLESRMDQLVA